MAVALIVAAGRGERLGSGRPKALVTLAGKTMLEWSVATLRSLDAVEKIVVALPPGVEPGPLADAVITVTGGAFRSQSVRAALSAAGPGDPVIVHDAARPMASASLFARTLEELARTGADGAIAAAPVTDTIKEVDAGRTVRRTLERSALWAVQTPQAFRRGILERVLRDADDELLAAATDDAWLVERIGGALTVVESDASNLKITTGTDLRIAEMLLER